MRAGPRRSPPGERRAATLGGIHDHRYRAPARRRPVALPPQLHVFVRDWLSSNNVLLKSRDGHVLIDSGYGTHAPLTLALLAAARGLGGDPLANIVNTHCHSDHIGGNAAMCESTAARSPCPPAKRR